MEQINILIVEDEFIVAKDLQAYLEKLGYAVCGRVNSGEKAIQHVGITPTDVVLMDIMLKGEITGIEAAAQIREQFHIPIIYVTANTNPGIVAQAKVTEPFGFIVKPFNERELHANIEMSLYKHRMEQSLARQKSLLDEVFTGVQEGIALLDEFLNIVFCNPAYAALAGVSKAELTGKNAFLFFGDDARSLLVQKMRTREAIESSTYELPLITMQQGTRKHVRITVSPRRDQDGTVIGEFVTMLDITGRKLAEDELQNHKNHLEELVERRTSELVQSNTQLAREIKEHQQTAQALRKQSKLLDDVFTSIQEGIVIVDECENIEFCNPAWADIFDQGLGTLFGRNVLDFFDKEQREIILKETEKRRRNESSVYELVLTTKSGVQKYLRVSASPRFRDKAAYAGAFAVIMDMTERKQNELALQEAKDASEAASRAKSEFIANTSHELRTPLHGILGYAQILENNENLTPLQREGIATIRSSGEHLLSILNDILDLAKLDAGKLRITSEPFYVSDALNKFVRVHRVHAQQKGLIFSYEEEGTIPYVVYGDEKRLRQVLFNLLGNAVKFTEQGRVTFKVTHRQDDDESQQPSGVTLQFSVEDTGIGIAAEHLNRIFEPFEQLIDKQLFIEGTGLGLTVSRRLLRMMGSELHVESQEGQGSRFWFELEFFECSDAEKYLNL